MSFSTKIHRNARTRAFEWLYLSLIVVRAKEYEMGINACKALQWREMRSRNYVILGLDMTIQTLQFIVVCTLPLNALICS